MRERQPIYIFKSQVDLSQSISFIYKNIMLTNSQNYRQHCKQLKCAKTAERNTPEAPSFARLTRVRIGAKLQRPVVEGKPYKYWASFTCTPVDFRSPT